jgi:hypothetical protein
MAVLESLAEIRRSTRQHSFSQACYTMIDNRVGKILLECPRFVAGMIEKSSSLR